MWSTPSETRLRRLRSPIAVRPGGRQVTQSGVQAVLEARGDLPGRVLAAAHRDQAVVAAVRVPPRPLHQARPVGGARVPVDRRAAPRGPGRPCRRRRRRARGSAACRAGRSDCTTSLEPSLGRGRRRKKRAGDVEDTTVLMIVNIGLSNIGSVRQALSRVGAREHDGALGRRAGRARARSSCPASARSATAWRRCATRASSEPLRRARRRGPPAARHLPRHAAAGRRPARSTATTRGSASCPGASCA